MLLPAPSPIPDAAAPPPIPTPLRLPRPPPRQHDAFPVPPRVGHRIASLPTPILLRPRPLLDVRFDGLRKGFLDLLPIRHDALIVSCQARSRCICGKPHCGVVGRPKAPTDILGRWLRRPWYLALTHIQLALFQGEEGRKQEHKHKFAHRDERSSLLLILLHRNSSATN